MIRDTFPKELQSHFYSNEEGMKLTVKSGTTIASGFATSEPHTFCSSLWDFIQNEDIRDLEYKQALFMAPHNLCVGDALSSKGLFEEIVSHGGSTLFGGIAKKINGATKKLEGLKRLVHHYEELKARNIKFTSPFIGGATNIIIPINAMTSTLYPDYVGRNTTRMGVTDMQSIHFPDAVDSMAYDPDHNPVVSTFIAVVSAPNEDGDMSNGPANGANQEILELLVQEKNANLLLYINPNYPFVKGYGDAPNTINVRDLIPLAEAGRLFLVEDDGKIPSLPAGSFDNPTAVEQAIAENVVNHIEMNKRFTYDRAIQVGFGSTGVLAIRALKDSSWEGRSYTEMMEPFTLGLWEAGKIKGSHFIEKNGTRTQLDGKMMCTFTIGEEGSDFYKKIDNHPALRQSAASRVVIPEGFYGGLGINNCLAVDFYGHVNSGGRYRNHHSGIGGGAQIFRGLGNGGVGYLCLKSTHTSPDGKLRSSIVPTMPKGTPISHVGPDLMGGRNGARLFIATEHGVGQVSGKSQSEFIKAMISIADPQFRDWLKERAYREFRITF